MRFCSVTLQVCGYEHCALSSSRPKKKDVLELPKNHSDSCRRLCFATENSTAEDMLCSIFCRASTHPSPEKTVVERTDQFDTALCPGADHTLCAPTTRVSPNTGSVANCFCVCYPRFVVVDAEHKIDVHDVLRRQSKFVGQFFLCYSHSEWFLHGWVRFRSTEQLVDFRCSTTPTNRKYHFDHERRPVAPTLHNFDFTCLIGQ